MKMSVSEFELLMAAELTSFRAELVRDHAEMNLTPCEWYCLFARYLREQDIVEVVVAIIKGDMHA